MCSSKLFWHGNNFVVSCHVKQQSGIFEYEAWWSRIKKTSVPVHFWSSHNYRSLAAFCKMQKEKNIFLLGGRELFSVSFLSTDASSRYHQNFFPVSCHNNLFVWTLKLECQKILSLKMTEKTLIICCFILLRNLFQSWVFFVFSPLIINL